MDEQKLIYFSLLLGGISIFSTFLPPVCDIALSSQTISERRVLRETELIGAGQLVLCATICSVFAKSPLPILLSGILIATMFATYEYAIQR